MKFSVVNKSTILNRFVLHTLQRNITHLAVITREPNIKLVILKGGELEKSQVLLIPYNGNTKIDRNQIRVRSKMCHFDYPKENLEKAKCSSF